MLWLACVSGILTNCSLLAEAEHSVVCPSAKFPSQIRIITDVVIAVAFGTKQAREGEEQPLRDILLELST